MFAVPHMAALPILERQVIAARYRLTGPALSCRQAATRLGLSRRSVSAIEHRALDRLRAMYDVAAAA
jgi:DNA-directed RNA polymerase specialized sigma subunit